MNNEHEPVVKSSIVKKSALTNTDKIYVTFALPDRSGIFCYSVISYPDVRVIDFNIFTKCPVRRLGTGLFTVGHNAAVAAALLFIQLAS
jgi:hypothetical protein